MHYGDYYWKNGTPIGTGKGEEKSYRIVHDPYHKWVSIELYNNEKYEKTIYDSHLLNFKTLNPDAQRAWQNTPIASTDSETTCLIRDEDDRAILIERHYFEKDKCRECHVHSIHGPLVLLQKMYYQELGDPFDGVILFDSNSHEVMRKSFIHEI